MDKMTKTLAVLLFVSLAGNFFLGGMMLAQKMGGYQGRPDIMSMNDFTEKDRDILKKSMEDTRKKMSAVRKDLDDIRKDVQAAMHADPFDQESLDEALKMEKEKKAEILRIIRAAREEVMGQLSENGRRVVQKMAPRSSGYMVKMRGRSAGGDDFPLMWEEWDDMPPPHEDGRPPAP